MKPTQPPTKWKRGGGRWGGKGIVKLDVKNEWSNISTNAYALTLYTTTILPSAFFFTIFLCVYEILCLLCCFDA